MEDNLHSSLSIIKNIGNSFQDGYVLIDRDYKIIWVNEFLEKKGFKLENIKGTYYFKTFSNKDEADANCPSATAFKTGRVEHKIESGGDGKQYDVTSIPLKFDDEIKFVLEISKAKDENGPLAENGAEAEKKDIKPNRKLEYDENKLLNSEYVAEHCFDSIFFTDKDKRIICVNPSFEKLKGCGKEEVIGDVPVIFKSKKTDPGIYREFWRAVNKGKIWEQEFHGKRKDGSTYYSDLKIIPIKDELGNVKNFMVVEKDISDWKKSEEKLIGYKSFPDENPDPIVQTDYNGDIKFMGKKTRLIFDEIKVKNIKRIIGEDFKILLSEIKYTGKEKKIKNTIMMKDKYYQVTASSDIPSIERINFYFSDITEIKKLEKNLTEKNEELEKFNKMAVGRELKMIELKKRVKELENNLRKK
jgi:PAS domain S-box-containing protein